MPSRWQICNLRDAHLQVSSDVTSATLELRADPHLRESRYPVETIIVALQKVENAISNKNSRAYY